MKIVAFILLYLSSGCATSFLNSMRLQLNNSKEEIIIVDIDNTIADVSPIKFIFKGYKEIPALDKSVEVLLKLNKKYSIVYLTARHEVFRDHTMNWLSYNGFPLGPVLFWNLSEFPFFDSDYKTLRLSEIKNQDIKIAFAVGDKDSDIKAYTRNGIKSFIIRDDIPRDQSKLVSFVNSWEEIFSLVDQKVSSKF